MHEVLTHWCQLAGVGRTAVTELRAAVDNGQCMQSSRANRESSGNCVGARIRYSSTLFRLPNGALRSPDASWIQAARWQSLSDQERKSFPPVAPDFVIELRSQTDRVIDLQQKMKEYASCGVRLGWLIDPLQKQVHIYRPIEPPAVLSEPHSVSDESVLPGFVLELSRIFA